jgi:hypothetical protein
MCIRRKTCERLGETRLYPSFKPDTQKRYILRHCINNVYLSDQ